MKLPFEYWVESQKFSDPVNRIFSEAFKCFRVEAYRASMLLSYIAFQTIIKERLLAAYNLPPAGYDLTRWQNQWIAPLRNEEKWDERVKDALQCQAPAIFIINDDLRRQILVWKDRRNDCAHGKSTDIRYYHIESFWGFIKDNLAKLMVNGSKDALINKLDIHYDARLMPPSQDPSSLINEIATAILPGDLPDFFISVHSVFRKHSLTNTHSEINFFNSIFLQSTEEVKKQLITFLKSNHEILIPYLRNHPEKIVFFEFSPIFIRNLWYDVLFTSGLNDLSIYCELLRSELIPNAEIPEANERILNKFTTNLKPNTEIEKETLEQNGFFSLLENEVFIQGKLSDWGYSNQKAALISYFVENFPLKVEVVRKIASEFNSGYHPYEIRPMLNHLFTINPQKRREFVDLARGNNVDLPVYLESLI